MAAVPSDLLAARIHPLQSDTSPASLYWAAERVMTEAVAGTGVDLNAIIRSAHRSPLMQFVPGLGPRKASAALAVLAPAGRVLYRNQLLTRRAVTEKVYQNAAGFIRILPPGGASAVLYPSLHRKGKSRRGDNAVDDPAAYDPLDATRLHPEHIAFVLQARPLLLWQLYRMFTLSCTGVQRCGSGGWF